VSIEEKQNAAAKIAVDRCITKGEMQHEERLHGPASTDNLPTVHAEPPKHPMPMPFSVGEVFLESVSTGVITSEEIAWITSEQSRFDRQEEAMVLKLGRLLDAGEIQIGCRLLNNAARLAS